MWRTVLIFFPVLQKWVANEGVLPTFFILAKIFFIFLCCTVTYLNITPDTSAITANKIREKLQWYK